tara:strand:- start:156 stop:554 length:399 start_codon:yes stop_codon:yes gene_type:complete
MKKIRGYIFSREFLGERAPQHVQNIVIRDYCKKNNLEFFLSAVEYAMPDSSLMLEQIFKEIKLMDGIIAYSLFQLPNNKNLRNNIYDKIISNKKEFHFAVESMCIKANEDIIRIENIWNTKKNLNKCINNIE